MGGEGWGAVAISGPKASLDFWGPLLPMALEMDLPARGEGER
jgi:hypothetical protein